LLSPVPNGALQVTYQNDVSKGSFEVVVDIGRDYSTQREESIEALKDILISMPQDHPMYNDTLGEIIYLLPNNGLNNLQRKVRYEQLIGGAAPENDEERALVENIQSLQGAEKPKTPNDMLLESAALEQQTQAAMNQQKIEGMKFENLKKMEEAKKVQAQTAMIQAELKELIANGQANTLEAS
jgi:hypothetical protein